MDVLHGTRDMLNPWEAQGEAHQQIWAVKDRSVRPNKIQIALSIYHSILAQAALRTARMSTHISTSSHPNPTCVRNLETARNLPQQHRNHTRHLARLHTLGTQIQIQIQML